MRVDVQQFLLEHPELKQYIRRHPNWYRTLSRDPSQVMQLKKDADRYYGKTFPQRMERVQDQLGLVMMMMEMLKMNQVPSEGN